MANRYQTWNTDTLQKLERFVNEHFQRLEDIVRAIHDTQQDQQYTRKKAAVALDGTGAGQAQLQVPLGYDWVLERVTVSGGAGGQVIFSENSTAPSDTLEVVTLNANGLYSDAFSNDIFVPSGSVLLISATGAGNNGSIAYNLQIRLIKQLSQTQRSKATLIGEA